MTKEQKIEAYTMLLDGNTYADVARHFGVTGQYINRMFPHVCPPKTMDENECVYPAILEFMKGRGMTCSALAKKSGVQRNTLRSTLSGRFGPSKETIDKILSATGLTYEVAFKRRDKPDEETI